MRITLEELAVHPVVVSKTYSPEALDYRGAEFRQSAPLKVNAVAELRGVEIHLRGHLSTSLEASCDRCLGPVAIPVEWDFDLFYRPMATIARAEEVELPQDELDVGFFSGDGIEFDDVVTEQVILSVPMKLVCKTGCRGLCPACGINLNDAKCDCLPREDISPFSSLKKS